MPPIKCKSISCNNFVEPGNDFCNDCLQSEMFSKEEATNDAEFLMSAKYPKYYKDVSNLNEVDVYAVHQLFQINDPSGCIHHASKKLLLSGTRTGGKSAYQDIKEARDTLTRWLQLNLESA